MNSWIMLIIAGLVFAVGAYIASRFLPDDK
jgi:hypothetical protein